MPVEWLCPSARVTENDDEQVDATAGRNPDADHRVAAGAAGACLVRGTIREGAAASRTPRVLRRAQGISARESAGGRQVSRIVRRHGAGDDRHEGVQERDRREPIGHRARAW